jgi:hypothetical protein
MLFSNQGSSPYASPQATPHRGSNRFFGPPSPIEPPPIPIYDETLQNPYPRPEIRIRIPAPPDWAVSQSPSPKSPLAYSMPPNSWTSTYQSIETPFRSLSSQQMQQMPFQTSSEPLPRSSVPADISNMHYQRFDTPVSMNPDNRGTLFPAGSNWLGNQSTTFFSQSFGMSYTPQIVPPPPMPFSFPTSPFPAGNAPWRGRNASVGTIDTSKFDLEAVGVVVPPEKKPQQRNRSRDQHAPKRQKSSEMSPDDGDAANLYLLRQLAVFDGNSWTGNVSRSGENSEDSSNPRRSSLRRTKVIAGGYTETKEPRYRKGRWREKGKSRQRSQSRRKKKRNPQDWPKDKPKTQQNDSMTEPASLKELRYEDTTIRSPLSPVHPRPAQKAPHVAQKSPVSISTPKIMRRAKRKRPEETDDLDYRSMSRQHTTLARELRASTISKSFLDDEEKSEAAEQSSSDSSSSSSSSSSSDRPLMRRAAPEIWTPQQTLALVEVVAKNKERSWKTVAEMLNLRLGCLRTPSQCQQRYRRFADPNIKHAPWTEAEDKKLLAAVNSVGRRWSAVAKGIPGRPDIQCRRRWQSLVNFKQRESKAESEEDMDGSELSSSAEEDVGASYLPPRSNGAEGMTAENEVKL